MTNKQKGWAVILIGAGLVIAGTIISLKNLWVPGLVLPGVAAIFAGRWMLNNLKP
jgi:hypothetical protein